MGYEGCYMADDFADLKDTPVIRLKWWGSYLENIIDPDAGVTQFLIAFESDVPAVGEPNEAGYIPSYPGEIISTEIVTLGTAGSLNLGEYSEVPFALGSPRCEDLYEYEAILATPFPQDPNTVYWLKIVAVVDANSEIMDALEACGVPLCDLGKDTWSNIVGGICPELENQELTRWGWHNRDYTKMDPYASVSPAVHPGEHLAGKVTTFAGLDLEVWHFQDDAVSGEMSMGLDLAYPDVNQLTWQEEYYRYFWPLCESSMIPPITGIDGPPEIENFSKDLAFELWTGAYLDYGDAPETDPCGVATAYCTINAMDGARHIISANGPYFGDGFGGGAPDPEPDGQPDAVAMGDDNDGNDDENGVVIPALIVGKNATIIFNVGGPAAGGDVRAFIDWNADGDWTGTDEDLPVASYGAGPQAMTITVPATATVGPTFARFRISSQTGLLPSGLADDGEVEDYAVLILDDIPDPNLKFQQLPLDGPEYFGHDELSTAYTEEIDIYNGCYMADDFADLIDTPVFKIKWWGSYLENYIDPDAGVTRFLIAFESDVPAVGDPSDSGYIPSHPNEIMSTEIVTLGTAGSLD
jgi:hypothetical protein